MLGRLSEHLFLCLFHVALLLLCLHRVHYALDLWLDLSNPLVCLFEFLLLHHLTPLVPLQVLQCLIQRHHRLLFFREHLRTSEGFDLTQ